jgi:hypothetical protein
MTLEIDYHSQRLQGLLRRRVQGVVLLQSDGGYITVIADLDNKRCESGRLLDSTKQFCFVIFLVPLVDERDDLGSSRLEIVHRSTISRGMQHPPERHIIRMRLGGIHKDVPRHEFQSCVSLDPG